MKRFFSMFGVLVLVCFSFYYTEQAVRFIRGRDPIYQEIVARKDEFSVEAVNATIMEDNIIPGNYGKEVDVDASYTNMMRLGQFNESLLVFEEVVPTVSSNKQFDKYIIQGNKERDAVGFVFVVQDSTYVESVAQILANKDVSATFFVDGAWVENHSDLVDLLSKNGNEIENIGYDGSYVKERLLWTNNLIESITRVEPKYCYTKYRNSNTLDLCQNYHMYTVRPTILTGSYPFSSVKKNLTKGAIIHFDLTPSTVKELSTIISYIHQKGYRIEILSNLLSENEIVEK